VAKQLHMYEPQRRGTDRVIPRGDKASASPRLLQRFRNAKLDWKTANVHFGLVLSGEKLIDDAEFVQELLSHEPEAIGGEMEGAGLYGACLAAKKDWILVKAVCDWADGKKSKDETERQLKAARNAALFVWHALAHAPKKSDHQKRSKFASAPSLDSLARYWTKLYCAHSSVRCASAGLVLVRASRRIRPAEVASSVMESGATNGQ
jgi:hypothetical protein